MPVRITSGQSVKVVIPPDDDVEVTFVRGPQGPPGPQGPAGPQGAPGGALFEFVQDTPANPWIIAHNLNRFPHVTLIIDGEEVEADVTYGDENHVTISFPSPTAGKAEVS